MFERISDYYNCGVWDERRVRNAVAKGVITPSEFKAITGKEYEAA